MSAPRRLARRFGFDVVRWPDNRYEAQRQHILERHGIRTALDVGANAGQYGYYLRYFGYKDRILSFEPLMEPFRLLSQRAERDPNWKVQRVAVGSESGDVSINVASNQGASSSILDMLQAHREAAPQTTYVGTEVVRQITLDSIRSDPWLVAPLHLKIDVQGYEKWVLSGASHLLPLVQTVELELSFVALYEGGMLFAETVERMSAAGFRLAYISPAMRDAERDILMQSDGLFVRSP